MEANAPQPDLTETTGQDFTSRQGVGIPAVSFLCEQDRDGVGTPKLSHVGRE